jgi:uroporphyrinogen decarboxylase
MRQPDFNNLLKVLRCEEPDRPTLFEFFLNGRLYKQLAGPAWNDDPDLVKHFSKMVVCFKNAGYDYATVGGSSFGFPGGEHNRASTISLNEGFVITDRASFEAYKWLNPDDFLHEYASLDTIEPTLPDGMKFIVCGPGGVLENVIGLVGYDNLCFLIADEPDLVQEIFDAVGSRLVRHYEIVAPKPSVGACISNDDWGFKTQTMLSLEDMRRFVFPWHVKIVEAIHAGGKPAILHSCGNQELVMDDIIDVMKYDGKHSYEDVIEPVEQAYDRYGGRIAILGGIDVDFICRASLDEITARSRAMLERAKGKGGYALGTGNSVPEYIEDARYFAMTKAALEPAAV